MCGRSLATLSPLETLEDVLELAGDKPQHSTAFAVLCGNAGDGLDIVVVLRERDLTDELDVLLELLHRDDNQLPPMGNILITVHVHDDTHRSEERESLQAVGPVLHSLIAFHLVCSFVLERGLEGGAYLIELLLVVLADRAVRVGNES